MRLLTVPLLVHLPRTAGLRTSERRFPTPSIPTDNRYRFALPNETDSLGLPIGQHISIQATIDGKNVMRSYTPTSLDDDKGYFELVVKSYEKGNISKYLAGLNIGDTIQVRGPKGKFMYAQDLSPHLLMIAGGTGITPMFQIIKSSLKHATDQTELRLIYANVDESDIRKLSPSLNSNDSYSRGTRGARTKLERPSQDLRKSSSPHIATKLTAVRPQQPARRLDWRPGLCDKGHDPDAHA